MKKIRTCRILSLLTAAALCAGFLTAGASAVTVDPTTLSGSGTESAPWLIGDESELTTAFRMMFGQWNGDHFLITRDIYLTKPLDTGEVGSSMVTVIGASQPQNVGVFDGGGHTIYNFAVNSTSNEGKNFGFFEYNDGVIRDLNLSLAENYDHTGFDPVWGGIADYNGENGEIVNCSVTGNATMAFDGVYGYEGGCGLVVGKNWGAVTNCAAKGSINGPEGYTDGVVGSNDGGTVTDCVNQAAVNGRKASSRTCSSGSNCPSEGFSDVPDSAWYHEAVDAMLRSGWMNGVSGSSFAPEGTLSRAQLAQILYNRANRPSAGGGVSFNDVTRGVWYYDAVLWAVSEGYFSGYGDGNFGANDPVTRQQLAVVIWRYLGFPAAKTSSLSFTDAGQISDYALDAVRAGILSGFSDNTFRPNQPASRAQVAAIFYRIGG